MLRERFVRASDSSVTRLYNWGAIAWVSVASAARRRFCVAEVVLARALRRARRAS